MLIRRNIDAVLVLELFFISLKKPMFSVRTVMVVEDYKNIKKHINM